MYDSHTGNVNVNLCAGISLDLFEKAFFYYLSYLQLSNVGEIKGSNVQGENTNELNGGYNNWIGTGTGTGTNNENNRDKDTDRGRERACLRKIVHVIMGETYHMSTNA